MEFNQILQTTQQRQSNFCKSYFDISKYARMEKFWFAEICWDTITWINTELGLTVEGWLRAYDSLKADLDYKRADLRLDKTDLKSERTYVRP